MFTTIAFATGIVAALALALRYRLEGRRLEDATNLELERLRAELSKSRQAESVAKAASNALNVHRRELEAELADERAAHQAAAGRLAELELERLEAAGDSLERSRGLEVAVHTPRPDDQSWSGLLHRVTRTHLELAGAVHSESGPAAGLVLIPRTPAPAVQVLGPGKGAVEVPAEVG